MSKNVALKLDEGVYAQVALLAQLESTLTKPVSIPDVIRQAVNTHLDGKRQELTQRAGEVLADLDRKAAEERARIEAILGTPEAEGDQAKPKGSRRTEANAS